MGRVFLRVALVFYTPVFAAMVADYTGLDIARSAARYYHKPFVDNTFEAIWTIRVLEHIPEPEYALIEVRRVLKPFRGGGSISRCKIAPQEQTHG